MKSLHCAVTSLCINHIYYVINADDRLIKTPLYNVGLNSATPYGCGDDAEVAEVKSNRQSVAYTFETFKTNNVNTSVDVSTFAIILFLP